MELTRIMMSLDRVREAQMEAQSALQRQGALLHDLVLLNRETVKIQQQTVRMLGSISKARASTPPETSPVSSQPTAKDVLQWIAAVGMVTWVIKGGDPAPLLKMLGF
jgi:hypothetical protein